MLSKQVQERLQIAAAEESNRAREVSMHSSTPSPLHCLHAFEDNRYKSGVDDHCTAWQVAAMKAEWAQQEAETKAEEEQRHIRMQQVRNECEEFNRCTFTSFITGLHNTEMHASASRVSPLETDVHQILQNLTEGLACGPHCSWDSWSLM